MCVLIILVVLLVVLLFISCMGKTEEHFDDSPSLQYIFKAACSQKYGDEINNVIDACQNRYPCTPTNKNTCFNDQLTCKLNSPEWKQAEKCLSSYNPPCDNTMCNYGCNFYPSDEQDACLKICETCK